MGGQWLPGSVETTGLAALAGTLVAPPPGHAPHYGMNQTQPGLLAELQLY